MHDLEAACLAMYNDKPNVTCILGTGSNFVFLMEIKLLKMPHHLGLCLGDEGSGNYFEKNYQLLL